MTRILFTMAALLFASLAMANNTPHDLSTGPLLQDWSDTGLITNNDDWSNVPSIEGFQGGGLTSSTGVDPQTVLAADDPGTLDVLANQSNPSISAGGVAEFDGLANPVVAFQGSGTADAPYLRIYLNTAGRQDIRVQYLLRDIDPGADATQPVGLHYRLGNSGSWTNLPGGYVSDASAPGATAEFPIDVTLPAAADNQAEVQLRIMTTNAVGFDEFVGVDDINISSNPLAGPVVASAVVDNHVTVNGGNDGQATASGSGGVGPYTYLWSDAQTTATAVNLSAGIYSVTVTDDNGGNDVASVTITEPTALLATITTVIDESLPGAADGSATVSASGGVTPYSYLWSNGGTTATITGLAAGTYTVTVTDSNGATASPAPAVVGVAGSLPPIAVPSNATWALILLWMLIVLFAWRRRFNY